MTEKQQHDDRSFARSGTSLTEIATTLSSSSSSSSFSWSSSAPYSPPSSAGAVAEREEDRCPQDERGSGGSKSNNNNSILIRPYEKSDLEQVHALFAAGMRSHVGTFFRLVVSQPFVAVPVMAVAAAMAAIVMRRNSDNNNAAGTSCPSSWVVIALLAAVAGVVGLILCAIIFLMISEVFEKYIQRSIRSDLSRIDKVYAKPGAFLVAQDTTTGKIVGSVGGEYKKPQKRDNNNNNTDEKHDETDEGSGPVAVFELRRMSVDGAVQRQGLGRRLIAALEREIAIAAPAGADAEPSSHRVMTIKIILTCTSMQYAAHRLYRSAGFCLVHTKPISDGNLLFKSMRILSFEKVIYCFKGNNHGKNSNSSNKDNNTALAK